MPPALKLKQDNCQAYLVRMWRDSAQEPWRASLKAVAGGGELYFSSPEKMFLFLHRQMADATGSIDETGPADGDENRPHPDT